MRHVPLAVGIRVLTGIAALLGILLAVSAVGVYLFRTDPGFLARRLPFRELEGLGLEPAGARATPDSLGQDIVGRVIRAWRQISAR